jgi:hypothetical protein
MSKGEKRGIKELTYISVRVTGVPIKNLAKRKLKMRDVDPRGATYSEMNRQREVI